jgi:heme/copper-type cytochrome/quinol oxidase subunit 2
MQGIDMNVMIFWVCVAVGTVVYGAIIWSLVAYRKTKKHEASFHKSTAAEIAWTVIPLLIIIAMTIPAAKLLIRLYQSDTSEAEGRLVEPGRSQLVFENRNQHFLIAGIQPNSGHTGTLSQLPS